MPTTVPGAPTRTRQPDVTVALARLWMRSLAGFAVVIFGAIVTVLLGLSAPANTIPIVDLARRYPAFAAGGGGLLLVLTFGSLILASRGGRGDSDDEQPTPDTRRRGIPLLALSAAISTVSTALFVGLLAVLLVRPGWCPTALCPAPRAITNAAGAHDANLEVYLTGIQSTDYALPAGPDAYSLGHLPDGPGAVPAVRLGARPTTVPVRFAVGIHSLRQGSQYGLVIESVSVVVREVPALPYPLNVWHKSDAPRYSGSVFVATYRGEDSGAVLPASPVPADRPHVQLASGEADELDVEIDSLTPAELRFQVRVTYRVANSAQTATLTVPQVFDVDFSDTTNWHPYLLQGTHLTPAP